MPIYEYACKNCEHTLTALQKMSDDSLVDCPECGKPELRRLISAPRFRLKGAGWYETDFKKDNQRNIAKGDSESDKGAKTGSGDKAPDAGGKAAEGGSKKAEPAATSKTSESSSSSSNSKEAS